MVALCLEMAIYNCELLREVGLDLSFFLNQLFVYDILQAIDEYGKRYNIWIQKVHVYFANHLVDQWILFLKM